MKKERVVFENEDFNGSEKEIRKERTINRFFIGFVILALIATIIVIIVQRMKMDSKLYEATTSEYEIYCETKAYIINSENIVDYDKNSTIITLAQSNKRIAVGNVIAMYKTSEYDNAAKKLKEMDKNINEKIATLSTVYSTEVVQVENEIDSIIQKIKNTSSYIEINEYKSKLNELAYKKAKIVASLTPSGNELISLMNKRDEIEVEINSSSNNIKSDAAGVVVYKTDGLEGKYKGDSISKENIANIKKDFDSVHDEIFGIKIVDNFESYMIVEDDVDKKELMKEGSKYTIELIDKDATIRGELISIYESENEGKLNCVFRITNGVENLVEHRTTSVKVVWKKYTGFWVNNTSMINKNDINYVKILSLNDYVDIPVKVVATVDDKSLVNNYTKTELEGLNIERTRSLILYDRIVKDVSAISNAK